MKAWHISDTHLSFDKDWCPIKPMDERRWSKGVWTYIGYLDRIEAFGRDVIKPTDFVFITGDMVHDMKEPHVPQSLRWLRQKINGTIVICRGNHDKYWDVGRVRQLVSALPNFFIIDEGEIQTIGPYTIGCFSNHSKNMAFEDIDNRYIEMAENIVKQSTLKNKVPVMISHYPVNLKMAEAIGIAGVKAYMSGHIHCTAATTPGPDHPLDWSWYNQSAAQTDDKTINGCFFSTATTDVVQARHKQSFKEIKALEHFSVDHQELNKHKAGAINAFKTKGQYVNKFEKEDPFNPGNELAGFICREKGPMQGSLYITHVNGNAVIPQVIYGTPKLKYPYKNDNTRDFMDLPDYHQVFIAEKWNGMNVLFYKYEDFAGNTFVTAKSKGTPFLADSEYGNFLSLTKEAMKTKEVRHLLKILYGHNQLTADPDLLGISFELCGNKEPHLVKYDFDIALKPLFRIYKDGRIRPLEYSILRLDHVRNNENVIKDLQYYQHHDLIQNEMYRKEMGLPNKYEYEHFAVEGKVLYFVDNNGYAINNTMYKLKPKDIEEVHWQTFGKDMQGKVREAIHKIRSEGGEVHETTVRQELDMGPKEWDKFGKAIMAYVKSGQKRTAKVLLLCGLPGSGKTTMAQTLENDGYIRINQDDLGSRNACKTMMNMALSDNKSVVIDRCNFNVNQRKSWIELAHESGITDIRCVWLDVPSEICIDRASKRANHPTIADADGAAKAVNALAGLFIPPTMEEGFVEIAHLTYNKDVEFIDAVKQLITSNQ